MEQSHIDPPSDLIYLFLDGEATGVEQAVLFERLAHDGDLQAEFAAALKIRAATELERTRTRPPAAVTAALFRQAGFSSGSPAAGIVGLAGPASGITLRSILVPAAAAALGALVMALLFLLPDDSDRVADLERKLALLERRAAIDAPPIRMAPPVSTSEAGSMGRRAATPAGDDARETRTWRRERSVLPSGEVASTDDRSGNETPIIATPSLPTEQMVHTIEPDVEHATTSAAEQVPSIALRREPQVDPDAQPDDEPLMIAARSRSDLLYSPHQVPQASGPWFNNMSLAILYRLGSGLRLGLEGGQEDFPHYHLTDAGPVYVPRIVWGGATLDWAPSLVSSADVIRPSLRATLGATPIGPIGKGSIGIDLIPERRVSFTLAAEGTLLMYSHENMLFSARKLGLTYGVGVRF